MRKISRNEKGQFTKGTTPSNKKNLIGCRFGRLVVIAEAESKVQPSGQRKRQVLCKCDCGKECVVRAELLRNGATRSCGCIRSENSRKMHTKGFNKHIIEGGIVTIFNEDCSEYFLIDEQDLPVISQYHWTEDGDGYWITDINKKHFRVHQLLLGNNYDHKNGRRNDNRRENLRKSTAAQNAWNTAMHKDNKTGYKGVCKDKGKYQARICKNGIKENLGRYDTPEEAARAYDKRAKELFGEWARINFPNEFTERRSNNE